LENVEKFTSKVVKNEVSSLKNDFLDKSKDIFDKTKNILNKTKNIIVEPEKGLKSIKHLIKGKKIQNLSLENDDGWYIHKYQKYYDEILDLKFGKKGSFFLFLIFFFR
jgi:hypothetical protein